MNQFDSAAHGLIGGDEVVVKNCRYATPKAVAQFRDMASGDIESLFPASGDKIRLHADKSPFFIHETGDFRVTLCVKHGTPLEDGKFVVVGVQERIAKPNKRK